MTQVTILIGTVPWWKRPSLPFFISPININGTKQTHSQFQISSQCQEEECCWVSGSHKVDVEGWFSEKDSTPHLLEIRNSLGFHPPACKWREWQQVPSMNWLVTEMCSTHCFTVSSSWNWRNWQPSLNCPLLPDRSQEQMTIFLIQNPTPKNIQTTHGEWEQGLTRLSSKLACQNTRTF